MKIQVEGRTVWVNYHHLYCFYAVARSGSISEASKTLKIGPSALSIQLKQLEESLGFTLFERSHRKVEPNERGRIMLAYATEIFRLGSEMIEALNDRRNEARTQVRIGALDSIPKHLPVQLVEASLKHRNCSLSLVEGKPEELLKGLFDHRIDLVLSNVIPQLEGVTTYSKRIARLKLCIVGAKKFGKLSIGFPKSLDGQPMVAPTHDSRVRQDLENFMRENEFSADIIAETQDVMLQKLLAIRGVGLTVVPEYAVREYLQAGELVRIGDMEGCFEEVFLLSAARKVQNPIAQFLMKEFRVE